MGNNKKIKFQISMAVMVFIISFAVTWQIKGVRKANAVTGQMSSRVETLQASLKSEMEKNEGMMKQIVQLQTDLAKYREQAAQNGGATKILKDELVRAESVAGLTDLEGSGIIVTLKDGAKTDSVITYDDGYGIVHDSFILTILNELRASGAEALSINGERILATSEIRCVGPTVSINNTKIAAPFEIKAIGDPDTLENALRMPGGAVDESLFYGVELSIKKSNKLYIKKHSGATSFKYAQTVMPEVIE